MTTPRPERIDPARLVDLALAVVAGDRFPYLATIDGDQPRVRPVSPVRTERFTVYVANLRAYHKTEEIAANPRVELCYLDDHHDQVRITGVAELVTDRPLIQAIWDENPLLRRYLGSLDNPQFLLYCIRPVRVRYMKEWALEYHEVPLNGIVDQVRAKYASVAGSGLSSRQPGVRDVAEAFGYSPEELASIPAEANMGLSCGNPTAFASLRPGEIVLDLGCGGGLDVLLAAQKVGPTGKAIGIDMTPEMIDLARKNAAKTGSEDRRVEFHLARIDQLPMPDASVDCVISNCVINLAPDKRAVFREMFRVLKPGGRVAVSDIALKKPLPAEIGQDLMAYVGCIAGAIAIEEYVQDMALAGFQSVQVVDTGKDLNAYAKVENQAACCPPAMANSSSLPVTNAGCDGSTEVHRSLAELLEKYNVNDYAASVQVYALKS